MNIDNRKPLVIIAGPTAVGKSAVSAALAADIRGEVISADSVQVYRGLNIGSAKTSADEMNGIPHHLIDVINPDVNYDVAMFQKMAEEELSSVYRSGHLPILCGGTGFYIQALLYGIDFREENTEKSLLIRQELEKRAELPGGPEKLYAELISKDPDSVEKIHAHNVRRVIRALEYYELHGEPISRHNQEERMRPPVYDAMFFVLTDERDALYKRIDSRVDRMMENGLLDEVKWLHSLNLPPSLPAMQAIGYKELLLYLDGRITLPEAAALIKKNSKNYAKRQLTWFRREKDAIWVDISKFNYEKENITKWILTECMNHWV